MRKDLLNNNYYKHKDTHTHRQSDSQTSKSMDSCVHKQTPSADDV